ncbi:MAG: nucleotide exchange factor GrpE [Bacteroidaceae bacterium]|nr:nucleotide exchange factor GrpE [Bacteroidaceae bacterium]
MKEQNEEELKQNGSEIQEETSAHSDNADKMAEQEQQTEAEVKADETQPETAPEKEKTTEEKLQEAEEEIASLKDQLLRKIAEFDNYRKRTIKEKTELILNGGEKTVVAILPVLDDMERALTNMEKAEDVKAVVEGVKLIHKKFLDILSKQGVQPIDTKEAIFDVDLHEAIAQLPAPCDEMKGKVMDCTLTGYKLNEKVIRHAQVVVGL